MYFWNINKLKSDFSEGNVTEKNLLQYLVGYTILGCIAMIPMGETNQFDMLSAILMIPISILGVLYAYSCNGGDSGENFLAKYFAIGWVVTFRFIVIVLPIAIVLGVLAAISEVDLPENTSILDVIIDILLVSIIFWRTAFHINQMATPKPETLGATV